MVEVTFPTEATRVAEVWGYPVPAVGAVGAVDADAGSAGAGEAAVAVATAAAVVARPWWSFC